MTFIRAEVRAAGKWKLRSEETHRDTHTALFQDTTEPGANDHPSVVFIGDSMMERLKTTGTITTMNKSAMPKSGVELPRSMNLGVGGDKIENLLFRLAGTNQPDKSLDTPLWDLFEDRNKQGQSVKLWVLQIGTNNLRAPKGGLRPKEMALYELVVKALLELGGPGCRVLCTALFFRTDVEDAAVTTSNGEIEKLVAGMSERGEKRVLFMPAPTTIDKTVHLDDHVHLDEEGYKLWDEAMVPEVLRLVGE